MSRIWDALQKVEKLRDVEEVASSALPNGIRLTDKQRLAIRALLRTSTVEEAAAAADVTEVTLRRWLARPAFVAEYYRAGRNEIEESMRRLDSATETAMAVLEQAHELMDAVRTRCDRLGVATDTTTRDDCPRDENGRDASATETEPNGSVVA